MWIKARVANYRNIYPSCCLGKNKSRMCLTSRLGRNPKLCRHFAAATQNREVICCSAAESEEGSDNAQDGSSGIMVVGDTK